MYGTVLTIFLSQDLQGKNQEFAELLLGGLKFEWETETLTWEEQKYVLRIFPLIIKDFLI